LGANGHLINVTLNRNDNNGNPLIFVGDNGGNSTIENCTLGPSRLPLGSLTLPILLDRP